MQSLLRTGPRAVLLRLVDQSTRLLTGHPLWRLSQITPQIAVGGQHYPRGWRNMQAQGVTAVVNMREARFDDAARGIGGARYLHLPTRDNTPPTLDDLARGVGFVQEELAQGGLVYIHCGVGVGRAPTMAAAVFIASGMTPDAALATIRATRPFIHLTAAQMALLEAFARQTAEEVPHG
jgi:hypothetical protein